MVKIDKNGFAQSLNVVLSSGCFGEEQRDLICAALLNHSQTDPQFGLKFETEIDLFVNVLNKSFLTLKNPTSVSQFTIKIAELMQEFAAIEYFHPRNPNNSCFPHFLLHGILGRTDETTVYSKIKENIRIISETREIAEDWTSRGMRVKDFPISYRVSNGTYEDYFGISCDLHLDGYEARIAKVSFFLDQTKKEAYIITFQGPATDSDQENALKRFQNLSNWLSCDPRTFALRRVMKELMLDGFRGVYAIRPSEHLFHLDQHHGFLGRYEPQLKKSGFDKISACGSYLYKPLI